MDGKSSSFGDLSTHFWSWEFKCRCLKCLKKKVKVRVSSKLLFKLEMMIMIINNSAEKHRPVIVNSGNRCEEYNRLIGGVPNSAHVPNPVGEAADIRVKGMTPIELGLVAEEVGGLRIGIGKTYIHVDVRPPCPSKFWYYKNGIPIYSAKINNESLIEFYKEVTGLKI